MKYSKILFVMGLITLFMARPTLGMTPEMICEDCKNPFNQFILSKKTPGQTLDNYKKEFLNNPANARCASCDFTRFWQDCNLTDCTKKVNVLIRERHCPGPKNCQQQFTDDKFFYGQCYACDFNALLGGITSFPPDYDMKQ